MEKSQEEKKVSFSAIDYGYSNQESMPQESESNEKKKRFKRRNSFVIHKKKRTPTNDLDGNEMDMVAKVAATVTEKVKEKEEKVKEVDGRSEGNSLIKAETGELKEENFLKPQNQERVIEGSKKRLRNSKSVTPSPSKNRKSSI